MSDSITYLLATDPLAMPSPERRAWAEAVARELCGDADEITVRVAGEPECYLAIENHESTHCPYCAADIGKWWLKAMGKWWDGNRSDLTITTPCCGKPSSLNDLDYRGPQGFARFAIEVRNPSKPLEPHGLARLSAVAGLPMRIVWAHL